eukprot:9288759-Alexandrium_andersonii.AAC.1
MARLKTAAISVRLESGRPADSGLLGSSAAMPGPLLTAVTTVGLGKNPPRNLMLFCALRKACLLYTSPSPRD